MDKTSYDEINLMPYLSGMGHRWYLIVLTALLGALLAGLLAYRNPVQYQAIAYAVVFGERPALQLDPRYGTVNSYASDRYFRRQGFEYLAVSPVVETLIPTEVIALVAPDDYEPGSLAEQVSVATTEGDLMEVVAVSDSPEKAQRLATEWARAAVAYINGLYGTSSDVVTEAQVDEVRATHQEAQQRVEQFIAANPTARVDDHIENLTAILDSNQLANQTRYTELITLAQKIDLVLQDAVALREQLDQGNPVALGESLAALGLRAQAIGGIPLGVQLRLDTTADLSASSEELGAELDRLITSLRGQIEALHVKIEQAGTAISTNAPAENTGLTIEQRDGYYEELMGLMREKERMTGGLVALTQDRDVALEALQIVERKRAEQQLTALQPSVELRLASDALLPEDPLGRGTLLRAMVGGLSGLVLGTLGALVATILSLRAVTRRPPLAQPSDRPLFGD